VQPLWTAEVSNAFEKFTGSYFNSHYVEKNSNVEIVRGTFDDALRVASSRAKKSYHFNQAQAIIKGNDSEWMVAAVGDFKKSSFRYVMIDGVAGTESFDQSFGGIKSVRRDNPNFVALVGVQEWMDFRPEPVAPEEKKEVAPPSTADDKTDPWLR
jgi:hypothetical protein